MIQLIGVSVFYLVIIYKEKHKIRRITFHCFFAIAHRNRGEAAYSRELLRIGRWQGLVTPLQ